MLRILYLQKIYHANCKNSIVSTASFTTVKASDFPPYPQLLIFILNLKLVKTFSLFLYIFYFNFSDFLNSFCYVIVIFIILKNIYYYLSVMHFYFIFSFRSVLVLFTSVY